MALVPRAQIPGVAPAIGGIRVPTAAPLGAFGGGEDTAAAFGASHQLAQEAGGIFQKHLEEAIQSETADNLAKLSAEETRLKTELSNVRGKDALAAQQKSIEEFDKFHGNLSQKIGNPVVSKAIAQHYQQFKGSLNAWGTQYANAQFRQYQDESDSSLIQSERDAAIADGTPERVSLSLARQEAAIKNAAQRNGWSPEKVKAETDQATSATHFGVFSMISSARGDLAAKSYYEANKDKFIGNDAIRAAKMVEQDTKLGEAYRLSDLVMSYEPETLKAAQDHFEKIADNASPEVRQLAERLMAQKFEVQKAAKQEAYRKDVQEAANIIEENPDIRAIPSELRSRLNRTDISALATRAAQIKKGEAPVTNWGVYSNLKDMAADPNRRKDFLSMLPITFRNDLADTEFKELVGIREGFIKGDEKTKQKMDGYRTISGIVGGTLDANGFTEHNSPVERQTIEQIMDEEIKYYRTKHNGEDPPNEEVQKMITKLTTDAVVEPGIIFDSKEKGYITTGKFLSFADTGIPADERKKIEEAMGRNGVVPTRRAIIETWFQKKSMDQYKQWLPK